MDTPEASTELDPNVLAPLREGTRVRLHSGRQFGTVTKIVNDYRVKVRWDGGGTSHWHQRELVIIAPQEES